MRDRTDLTSIQVKRKQKEIIDQAYEQYLASLTGSYQEFITRGEFLAALCVQYYLDNK